MLKRSFLATAVTVALAGLNGVAHAHGMGEVPADSQGHITVFVAKKIVTMDPTRPVATAVAVRDGKVLSVGSLKDLAPWLKDKKFTVDEQFKDKVLMPGLIDPHMHPMLGAISFEAFWITPEAWDVMGRKTPATTTPETYMKALKAAFAAQGTKDPIFMTWGYSADFHGEMSTAVLDTVSKTQPIMVMQRSLHEVFFNTAAMEYLKKKGFDATKVQGHPQVDLVKGHFWEDGMFSIVLPYIADYILAPARVDKGYARTRDYLTYNGVTTVGDMATGSTNWDLEIAALKRTFEKDDSPVRVRLTPDVYKLSAAMKGGADEVLDMVSKLATKNSRHLVFNNGIKLFADGAMFSQAMQISEPGYIDGHAGQWIIQPAPFEEYARRYWNAGYQIHVHTNGDGGAKLVLDTLEKLENEKPRVDHRFTVEHYGYANDGTSRRIAKLGAQVSANPFYLYDLGDIYAQSGLGVDRASRIAPLGGLVRRDVPVSLHSDFPMAPANPLYLAWCTASRETTSGKVFAPTERLTVDQAIRGVTIDAAYVLHMEDKLGSIEAGKTADFAVLDKDPYEVGVKGLRSIKVWGTVFEGQAFQAKPAESSTEKTLKSINR
ncbi:amidohydrolase [Roseateles koreensis]|uniref:Amidohydrolase n=1 Tax=Roseateles koreensis TaxID=2987526 RepID=A0ABT5KVD5_9BURK|nr:amidohydrolase [Roseateles koreensis]MDC8786889.1 amidohydrolase [Roseateles koreensis]